MSASSSPVKILAFAGSTRKESWNKKLVRAAAASLAGTPDVEVTFIDLADYPLPLYDGDLHDAQGLPENAKRLKQLFVDTHGFLVAAPEFNGSYPGVLKNALDWISASDKSVPGEPFKGKVAALMSASPGQRGGLRGLEKLRELFLDMQILVLPEIFAVGSIATVFNEAGRVSDERTAAKLRDLTAQLARTARKLVI